MQSLMTIGSEIKKLEYFENLITTRTPTTTTTTLTALGDPFPGAQQQSFAYMWRFSGSADPMSLVLV